jgi:UTP-glucose-1-phosphate uridylyltransferase
MGYLEAFVEAGLHRKEYREDFRKLLKQIVLREKIV